MLLLTIFLFGGASGRHLVWRGGFSWADGSHWTKGRAPCSSESAVFPRQVVLEVVLPPGTHGLAELVLPSDGELLLQDWATLAIGASSADSDCPSGENVWLSIDGARWLDTGSWSGVNPATPDAEKLPCPTDTVEFPEGKSLRVILPPFSVSVASVIMNNMMATTEDLAGSAAFQGGPLYVTGAPCSDPAGCECPIQEYSEIICPSMACPEPECLGPVRAIGDCCSKCGAQLLFEVEERTDISQVQVAVRREVAGVLPWYVSRTGGYVQVVLRQEEEDQDVEGISERIKEKLSTGRLRLRSHAVAVSGPYMSSTTIHSPFFIFFFTLFLVAIGFGATFYYFERSRGNWPSWLGGRPEVTFARFENLSGIVEIRPPVPRPSVSRIPPEVRGFDNPMYSSQAGAGPIGRESLLEDEDNLDVASSISDDSNLSDDRKTVTTLAVTEDHIMEDIPIGKLID